MSLSLSEAESLVRDGIADLRGGRLTDARARFERVIAAETSLPKPWLLLAQACHHLGDASGEEYALDKLLLADMRNLAGLLMKADLRARAGDDRAASSFYRTALNVAGIMDNVPQMLVPMLQRAEAYLNSASARFEAHLVDRLGSAAVQQSGLGSRVRQSVDLLLGKSTLYLQQPSSFYFPGLPQRQFYERDEFPWLAEIEAEVPAMQEELRAVLAETQEFTPYVEGSPDRPRPNNHLLGDPSWGAFYFWRNGARVAENAARCPRTMAALDHAPQPIITARSPMALYSVLKPGTHIAPHHGMLNTRLICHIPLMVPGDCALRVGNETRAWEEGKALIFDDSIEHEAWNRSDSTRVILLFEVWRPEISADERAELAAIFSAIDEYQGVPEEAI